MVGRKFHLALAAAFLFFSSDTFAGTGGFLPTIAGVAGEFDVQLMRELNKLNMNGYTIKSTDAYAAETFRLSTVGYVYHPRFITFFAKGSGRLQSEVFTNGSGETARSSSGRGDYEFRMKLLPEHPYSLELYTLTRWPATRANLFVNDRPLDREQGAILTYAKHPLFLTASHTDNTLTSGFSRIDSSSNRVGGSYVIGPFSNSAEYSRTETDSGTTARTTRDYSFFENSLQLRDFTLISRIAATKFDQENSLSQFLASESREWSEQMRLQLPWNFNAGASYREQREELITAANGADLAVASSIESRTEQGEVFLSHRLYDSVKTTYSRDYLISRSTSGELSIESHYLSGVYTKKIPNGRLITGFYGRSSVTDRKDSPAIVNEEHFATLFGDFQLKGERLDEASITVRVVSDTGALMQLTEDMHYVIEPFGAAFRIFILSLPSELLAAHPLEFTYKFIVSYSLSPGDAVLETTTVGYNLRLMLLDNRLVPYFSRSHTYQEVRSGEFPGADQDSEVTIAGIGYKIGLYGFTGEYTRVDSESSPARSFKLTTDYNNPLTDTMNIFARLQHSRTRYPLRESGEIRGYTETTNGLDFRLQRTVPNSNLNFSLGSSMSFRRGPLDTNTSIINANVFWTKGRLRLTAGALSSHTKTISQSGRQEATTENYYLTLSRKVF